MQSKLLLLTPLRQYNADTICEQQSLSLVQLSPKFPHALTDIIDVVSITITVRKEKRIVMRGGMNC